VLPAEARSKLEKGWISSLFLLAMLFICWVIIFIILQRAASFWKMQAFDFSWPTDVILSMKSLPTTEPGDL